MAEEFENLINGERLKAKNESLKIKMMLENGAKFWGGAVKISPDIEKEFLLYIKAYERQAANPKYIKLYGKIQRTVQFIREAEIADDKIESAWEVIAYYMQNYSASLAVCSPNISVRELYRFTTEEFFDE